MRSPGSCFAVVAWFCALAPPALALEASEVRRATGVEAGLAVHLGTTDGRLEAGLAEGGRMLVHGLAPDRASRDRARATLQARGLYGLASVETLASFAALPYADNLVDLLVADLDVLGAAAPPQEEVRRVLAPRGVAFLKQGGTWSAHVEPVPEAMDEWTHWDYGPAGNPVSRDALVRPTTSLRWYAGPTTTDNAADKVGLRLVGGRVFYPLRDYGYRHLVRRGTRRHLVARNAFNGVLLWKRPIDDVPGRGDNPPRFALTATPERLLAIREAGGPLEAIDPATGQTLLRYDQLPAPPKYEKRRYWDEPASDFHFIVRCLDGKLLYAYRDAITLVEAATGRRLWAYRAGEGRQVGWAVAGEGKVFATLSRRPLAKARASVATVLGSVVALDAATGRPLWRRDGWDGAHMYRMVYAQGSVIVPTFQPEKPQKLGYREAYTVTCLRAADGSVRWRTEEKHSAHGHYQVVLVRGGRVTVGQQRGFSLDLETGEFLAKHTWGQYDAACADLRGLPGYTFYGLTFLDDAGRRITRGQARSRCDTGVFPAYGLMYAGPSGCLCSNFVNGYLALAAQPPPRPVPDARRLERAGGHVELSPPAPWPADDEWPIHLGNPRRGSSTRGGAAEHLAPLWSAAVAEPPKGLLATDWAENDDTVGLVSALTVADGKVFVAVPDAHRVVALDARTGREAWSFTAGGRVDSPPTVYRGLCLFGSRDGRVTCLRAADGKLLWRFLAAVRERRIVAQSQLESPWPVHGSVMVHDGQVVFTAGRQSAIDQGIQVYALDPATGALEWKTRVWTDPDADPQDEPRSHRYQPDYRRTQSLLVSDGRRLYHAIDPLKSDYGEGESVALIPRTASNRGGWVTSQKDLQHSARDITVLWANSNGFLSRRVEGVGRFDFPGVCYSDLFGEKIVLAERRLYLLSRGGYGRRFPGLSLFRLGPQGRPAPKPEWTAKVDTGRHHYAACVLAGERLLLAGHPRHGEDAFLAVHSAADGTRQAEHGLPARPVRDGLAVAYGRIYLAGSDGTVTCLAETP
ncbi:MAG: PQQ-binding-like beta-propeller repeat protein [Candidatus Brocadiia bacterium]